MHRGLSMSDNTYNRRAQNKQSEDLFDIRSQVDLLHKLHLKVDEERRKNRTLMGIVGLLVLVAEIVNIITKLIEV